jgi:hypothetical protein
LRRFNLVMGFLHLAQGIFMIAISNATTFPIYTNFLRFDPAKMTLVPNPTLAYNLRFGPAVAVFLLLSALAHFALSTFGYKWYVAKLKSGMNPARFYEYALSSSLMIVLIGMLVGVSDLGALILMFGVNAMMNLFGIMMELHNQTKEDGLDCLHLRLPGRDLPLDRYLSILLWIACLLRRQTAGVHVCHRSDHLRVLQHLCGQHGTAV